MSNAGKPLLDNPQQAVVDAELAKFEAQWQKDHGPRAHLDLDAHGATWDEGDTVGAAVTPTGTAKPRLTMEEWRASLKSHNAARRDFIRTNPVIQAALGKELAQKAIAANKSFVRTALTVVVAAAVRATRKAGK